MLYPSPREEGCPMASFHGSTSLYKRKLSYRNMTYGRPFPGWVLGDPIYLPSADTRYINPTGKSESTSFFLDPWTWSVPYTRGLRSLSKMNGFPYRNSLNSFMAHTTTTRLLFKRRIPCLSWHQLPGGVTYWAYTSLVLGVHLPRSPKERWFRTAYFICT